ncbi:hypothetical protein GIB67_020392 [Kingdonia uniflora]|uniref:SMP domain-containing protein n=1 Tax=Kingdonia uniflora TaxID=39325 RepID=A0A7J7LBF3_9MAGN|nr:hypothetical protein GIB67_020392 [Kingdonia uniflora]
MSQEQPTRLQEEPIKYGDVFPVFGDLASKPISPQDAAMMQTAENLVLGQTQKGGAAAVMQWAAIRNESAGVVGHTDIAGEQGISVTEADVPHQLIVSESVAGQVISLSPFLAPHTSMLSVLLLTSKITPDAITYPAGELEPDFITIGEALEATAIAAGDRLIDKSDAAAIQAAEMIATGSAIISPGGVAAEAQSAASGNARMLHDENKTELADVLTDAITKLPADKAVTLEDAEGVMDAELRNNPKMSTRTDSVAICMAEAAKVNQNL